MRGSKSKASWVSEIGGRCQVIEITFRLKHLLNSMDFPLCFISDYFIAWINCYSVFSQSNEKFQFSRFVLEEGIYQEYIVSEGN
jgi:hypothetical protein